jgi:hypothetical protein
MPRLPHTIDFNDQDYPELAHIFRGIDISIAAIVASDPALRTKPTPKRRSRSSQTNTAGSRRVPAQRHAA